MTLLIRIIKTISLLLILTSFAQQSCAQGAVSIHKMNLMKKSLSDSFVFMKYEPADFFYKNVTDTILDAHSFRYTVIDSFIVGLRFDSFECCKYALGFLINENSGICFVFKPHSFIPSNYTGQTYFLNVNEVSYYNQVEDVWYRASVGYYWLPLKKVIDFNKGNVYTFYRNDKKEVGLLRVNPTNESVFKLYSQLLLYFNNIREFQLSVLKEKSNFSEDEHNFRITPMSQEEMQKKKEGGLYNAD